MSELFDLEPRSAKASRKEPRVASERKVLGLDIWDEWGTCACSISSYTVG